MAPYPVQDSTFQMFAWLWSVLLVGVLGTTGWIIRQIVRWKRTTDKRLVRLEERDQVVRSRVAYLEEDWDRFHPRQEVWRRPPTHD